MVLAWYEDHWYQGICEIEVKEVETRIFIQVRAPSHEGNNPTPVGRSRYCSYSSKSHKYNIWDNISGHRRLGDMEHHMRVVFSLEYELGEVWVALDPSCLPLGLRIGSIWGLSLMPISIGVGLYWSLFWLDVSSPPRGSSFYTHGYPIVQVELARQVCIRFE
jgi:hypothetical protein